MPVQFHSADVQFKLSNKKAYTSFLISRVKKQCNKKPELSYIFCSDSYLLNMNRQFLKHDYYTDIITFPLAETDNLLEAEIYISIDRVGENALTHKVSFDLELQRVMFHGILHLLGFKDKSAVQQKQMRAMENQWIKEFQLFKQK